MLEQVWDFEVQQILLDKVNRFADGSAMGSDPKVTKLAKITKFLKIDLCRGGFPQINPTQRITVVNPPDLLVYLKA